MYTGRINRPLIKQDAKRIFAQNWKVLVISGIILTVIQLVLNQLTHNFVPQLTLRIPAQVMKDYDTFALWAENYWRSYPLLWTVTSTTIAALMGLLSLIVITPLSFGFIETCKKSLDPNETPEMTTMLLWCASFKRIVRSIWMTIVIGLYAVLWGIIFSLPAAAFLLCATLIPALSLPVYSLLLILGLISAFAGILATVIKMLPLIMARCLLASEPERGVSAALRECRQLSKGRYMEFFVLCLSFILWQILSSITWGVAGLFVTPYFFITVLIFIREIRNPTVIPPVM